MSERSRKRLGNIAASLFALCVSARSAAAGEPQRIIIDWQGPLECNTSAAIQNEVNRLLAGAEATGAPLTVKLRVSRTETRYRLVIETTGDLQRELESGSCEELTKPTAVIIAFAIDPEATSRALEGASSEAEAPSPAESSAPLLVPKPPPPAARAPDEPRGGIEAMSKAPPHDAVTRPDERARSSGLHARAAAITDIGALPAPSTGPGAFAGAAFGAVRIEAGVFYLPARSATIDAQARKGADMDLIAAALLGCVLPFETAVELGACAGLEAGQVRGESFGIRSPGADSTDWLAARAGGFAGFRLDRRLALVIGGDAIARIGRSEFVIEGIGPVHRPSPFGFRADLGLELRFR